MTRVLKTIKHTTEEGFPRWVRLLHSRPFTLVPIKYIQKNKYIAAFLVLFSRYGMNYVLKNAQDSSIDMSPDSESLASPATDGFTIKSGVNDRCSAKPFITLNWHHSFYRALACPHLRF